MTYTRPVPPASRVRWSVVPATFAPLGLTTAAALLLYLLTLAPTVYTLDSAELTRAAFHLTPAHPPGYPLYVLLGRLFITLVPWGDVGYRMNLMSALFGALTAGMVAAVLVRLGCRALEAVTAALWLAGSFYFWSVAVMAEVYTLHAFFVAIVIWLVVTWRVRGESRWLHGLALAAGLGLANHLATALLAPGVGCGVGMGGRERPSSHLSPRPWSRSRLAAMATLLVLGLSPYLLVASRAEAPGARGRLAYVAAVDFWDLVFAYEAADYALEWARYGYELWGSFGGAGLAIGVVGLAHLWRRDRGLALSLLAMFAVNVAFFAGYRAADKQLMFAPTYLIWALWIGLGLHALGRRVAAAGPGSRWPALFQAGFVLAVAVTIGVNYRHADLSFDWRVRTAAERALSSLEANAVLLVPSWVDYHPVKYLQDVEGRRPDVAVVDVQAATPARLAEMVGAWLDDRPVYSLGPPRADPTTFRHDWQAACACYSLRRRDRP